MQGLPPSHSSEPGLSSPTRASLPLASETEPPFEAAPTADSSGALECGDSAALEASPSGSEERSGGKVAASQVEAPWALFLVRVLDHGAALIVLGALACLLGSLWLARTRLDMAGDRNAMFKTDAPYHQTLMAYKQEFGADDDSVILLSGPNPDDNHRAARMLGTKIRADKVHFENVYDCLDTSFLRRRLLFFLSPKDLKALHQRLAQAIPMLHVVMAHPGLTPLFTHLDRQVEQLVREQTRKQVQALQQGVLLAPSPKDLRQLHDLAAGLPLLNRVLLDMGASLLEAFEYNSPWVATLAKGSNAGLVGNLSREVFLDFRGGQTVIVLVRPKLDATLNTVPGVAATVRGMVAEVKRQIPHLEVTLTGKAMLESDEIETASRDSEAATLLSFAGVIILFCMAYRRPRRPLLALCCLLASLGWTVGFATLAIGHLNVLTVTVMPMLVGLGIDFGIQVITRYEEERVEGLPPLAAMARTLSGTGGSVITAGITTAASFQAIWLTRFAAIQELGLLAAVGIALSVVAMLGVLPAALLLAERKATEAGDADTMRWGRMETLANVERSLLAHPWGVLFFGLAFTLFCYRQFDHVRFDANVLHMQAPEVIALEKKLEANSDRGLLCAEVVVGNLEEARRREKQLNALATVHHVESLVPLIPTDQTAKLPLVMAIRQTVKGLPPPPKVAKTVDVPALQGALSRLRTVGLTVYPFLRTDGPLDLVVALRDFVQCTDCLLERIIHAAPGDAEGKLKNYQQALFGDLFEKIAMVREADSADPVSVQTLPAILRTTFIGRHGKWLLHVFPKENIWERAALERFLKDVWSVDPEATGTPVEIYHSTGLMMERYPKAARLALVVILVVVLLQFRAVGATLLVLFPLLIGLVWMVGLQGLLDVEYNPANFLAFSLILGVGVANGIYIVRRFDEEGKAAVFDVSTGRAILLSNLTAIMGFGSLMVAHHHGLYSLGQVMSLGIASCMGSSLIVLPALLQILAQRREAAVRLVALAERWRSVRS